MQGYSHKNNARKYITHRKLKENSTAAISEKVNRFIDENYITNGFEEFKLWKIK